MNSGFIPYTFKEMSTESGLPLFERRFRAIFEQTSVPSQIYSAEGHIKATNGAWHKWTGVPSEALDSIIAGGYCLLNDEQLLTSGVVENFRRALTGESVQTNPTFYDLSKTGPHEGTRWLQSNFYPIPDASGKIVEVLILHHDVTEMMTAQKKIEAALEEAEEALRMRDEFLSIASHELRTPVTGLQLSIQMLRRLLTKGDPADACKQSEECEKYVVRLASLINELLDLTRIRSGKIELCLEDCDLTDIASECVSRFVKARLTLKSSGPVFLRCDRNRVDQIFSNLITNAIKYGGEKPITITIEKSADGPSLTVRDEGCGIPREEQHKIFERFGRASSSAGVTGLGLGLYITRQIVEAHGGMISVDSAPGRGATFIVHFAKK